MRHQLWVALVISAWYCIPVPQGRQQKVGDCEACCDSGRLITTSALGAGLVCLFTGGPACVALGVAGFGASLVHTGACVWADPKASEQDRAMAAMSAGFSFWGVTSSLTVTLIDDAAAFTGSAVIAVVSNSMGGGAAWASMPQQRFMVLCGEPRAAGYYEAVGSYGGRPQYRHAEHSDAYIYWNPEKAAWICYVKGYKDGRILYLSSQDVLDPPLDGWIAYSGVLPVPSLSQFEHTYSFQRDLLSRWTNFADIGLNQDGPGWVWVKCCRSAAKGLPDTIGRFIPGERMIALHSERTRVAYLAMGAGQRYFLHTKTHLCGREFQDGMSVFTCHDNGNHYYWSGGQTFGEHVRQIGFENIDVVAFAPRYGWYARHSDGSSAWQDLPSSLHEALANNPPAQFVSISPAGAWFVQHFDGHLQHNGVPDSCHAKIEEQQKIGRHLRSIAFGYNDSWLVEFV